MAEGFARAKGNQLVDAYSAGTFPTGVVSPEAIEVMREKGIDISHQVSKGIGDVSFEGLDVVVSMANYSADDLCPASFRGHKINWAVPDPIGKPIDCFRIARDEIEGKVRSLLEWIWKEEPTR